MSEILILVNLAGAVAMLLWGTYVVRTGMLRTFGASLRSFLSRWLKNRFSGFGAGFVLASLLQSSTAAALLVSGLQKKGLVLTAIALASVFGADLGSAFMVRVMSLDLQAVPPVLIASGVFLFMKKADSAAGQFGRVLLGLGVVMLSLSMISSVTQPVKTSPWLMSLFSSLGSAAPGCAALGMALAFACFSSLAVVMIDAGLVASGALSSDAGLWVVIGANVGSAFLAFATTLGSDHMSRRAPTGNCVFRLCCAALGSAVLAFVPAVPEFFRGLASDQVIWFHVVFNAAAGVLGLCFLRPLSSLVDRLLPASPEVSTDTALLTEEALSDAENGFRAAAVELEKTCYFLGRFWYKARTLIRANPSVGAVMLLRQDYRMIRGRTRAVNAFLTKLVQTALCEEDVRRWAELKSQNSALQSVGREIDKLIAALDSHKCRKGRFFTKTGEAELMKLHDQVITDLEEAYGCFSPDDEERRVRSKRLLEAARKTLAEEERALVQSHIARISAREFQAVETSGLHLELLVRFTGIRMKICDIADMTQDRAGEEKNGDAEA